MSSGDRTEVIENEQRKRTSGVERTSKRNNLGADEIDTMCKTTEKWFLQKSSHFLINSVKKVFFASGILVHSASIRRWNQKCQEEAPND